MVIRDSGVSSNRTPLTLTFRRRSLRQWWRESKAFSAFVLLAIVVPSVLVFPLMYHEFWTAQLVFVAAFAIIAWELLSKWPDALQYGAKRWLAVLALMLLGGMFAGYLLSCQGTRGLAVIALVATGVFANDAAAQWIGQKLGKKFSRPIFPVTSPRKTIIGTVGGLIVGWLGGLIAMVLVHFLASVPWSFGIVLLTPPLAVLGDWTESRTKRKLGIEGDMSTWCGAHGGWSDRVDAIAAALIFAAIWFM